LNYFLAQKLKSTFVREDCMNEICKPFIFDNHHHYHLATVTRRLDFRRGIFLCWAHLEEVVDIF